MHIFIVHLTEEFTWQIYFSSRWMCEHLFLKYRQRQNDKQNK